MKNYQELSTQFPTPEDDRRVYQTPQIVQALQAKHRLCGE